MEGCFWLVLQAQKGDTYFIELAERVEYGKYAIRSRPSSGLVHAWSNIDLKHHADDMFAFVRECEHAYTHRCQEGRLLLQCVKLLSAKRQHRHTNCYASLCSAIQRQKMLTNPRFGALKACLPTCLLLLSCCYIVSVICSAFSRTYVHMHAYMRSIPLHSIRSVSA